MNVYSALVQFCGFGYGIMKTMLTFILLCHLIAT